MVDIRARTNASCVQHACNAIRVSYIEGESSPCCGTAVRSTTTMCIAKMGVQTEPVTVPTVGFMLGKAHATGCTPSDASDAAVTIASQARRHPESGSITGNRRHQQPTSAWYMWYGTSQSMKSAHAHTVHESVNLSLSACVCVGGCVCARVCVCVCVCVPDREVPSRSVGGS